MFLVVTRNFPPELGGMQNLMEGLSNALLNHGPVKVFADNSENANTYDESSNLSIQRVSGLKIFRKYRKANLIKEYLETNDLRASFFDHWKSIENIDDREWRENMFNVEPLKARAEMLVRNRRLCWKRNTWAMRTRQALAHWHPREPRAVLA